MSFWDIVGTVVKFTDKLGSIGGTEKEKSDTAKVDSSSLFDQTPQLTQIETPPLIDPNLNEEDQTLQLLKALQEDSSNLFSGIFTRTQ